MAALNPGYSYKAHVLGVVDGDTLDCQVDLGFYATMRLRLRLARVNCPELHALDPNERKRAEAAKSHTQTIVGRDVIVRTQKADAFGRWLAEVDYGTGQNLNDELLNGALAVPYARRR